MRCIQKAIAVGLVFLGVGGQAADYRYSTRLTPNDYLLRSLDSHRDPVFDDYKTIDLGASIGVGSDCGRIDFTNTLRASLRNILDFKYFGDVGKNIIASSPMLLTCYFSPTWCAILKHSQISAQYLSQMRLDQCSLVDKYVDSRVEDFYQERQKCVRGAIEQNGGDLERAMESCRGNKLWDVDLTNWAGSKNGEKVSENRLIESSAKWAGFQGEESKKSLNLVKAFVGDTVVGRGSVTVEYGPRSSALTPRTYLQSIEKATYDELCGRIVRRVEDAAEGTNPDGLVQDNELKALSPNFQYQLVDRQTIRALSVMPPKQRAVACKRLSDALAMTVFSQDVNRSLDVLTTLSQNPNLPDNRKREIEQKRKALKESIEMTVSLQRQRNVPLNTALSQINEEGQRIQGELVRERLSNEADSESSSRTEASFMDCADGVMCERR